MTPDIVLIHGYTGSPSDLAPLARHLTERFGQGAVHPICLPGHGNGRVSSFDADVYVAHIRTTLAKISTGQNRTVVVGHSTGGTLALAAITAAGWTPDLLVLAATPRHVDGSALERWERHRTGQSPIALGDVARMVSLINQMGGSPFAGNGTVLLIQGTGDALVPPAELAAWADLGFCGRVRQVRVPDAGHALFQESCGPAVADLIARAIADLMQDENPAQARAITRLEQLEQTPLSNFLAHAPEARHHLAGAPAVRRALGQSFVPAPTAPGDPLQLNIEVTTRCNLACPHCARSVHPRPAAQMPLSRFAYILDLLPNAYRIVLAGLGEPTLHPHIEGLIQCAAERHRHIALVTNATRLPRSRSARLIRAGLNAATFSLDSVDPRTAARVRPGAAPRTVMANIRDFTAMARPAGTATAVFTAVSARTIVHLPQLARAVVTLGVDAWMLTDLNFAWNGPHALNGCLRPEDRARVKEAIRIAFGNQVPVLGIRGLEALGMAARYREFLLYPPETLFSRSPRRTLCDSVWQTLPVDVYGNVTLCDCQPRAICGNLLQQPFSEIWNGNVMQAWRRKMVSNPPAEACRTCPRF